jgi:hypothetical protein
MNQARSFFLLIEVTHYSEPLFPEADFRATSIDRRCKGCGSGETQISIGGHKETIKIGGIIYKFDFIHLVL